MAGAFADVLRDGRRAYSVTMRFFHQCLAVVVLGLCWGAASGRVVSTQMPSQPPATLCEQIGKLSDQTSSNVLVIGEIHGTTQTPEAVRCASQKLLGDGIRVALALELPGKALEAVIVTQDKAARLRGNLQWDKFWDGKTSEAMFNLIAWAKQSGIEVFSVEALPSAAWVSNEARSALIGERIANRAFDLDQQYPDKRWQLVTLVGRFHAASFGTSEFPGKLLERGLGKPLIGMVKPMAGEAWLFKNQHGGVNDIPSDRCEFQTANGTGLVDLCLAQSTASLPAVFRTPRSVANDSINEVFGFN